MAAIHFIPIYKVHAERREVWGYGAEEAPDKSNEIMDYAASKPHFQEWSQRIQKASGGKSLGNLRAMHKAIAAGRIIGMEPRDAEKRIWIGAHVVDEAEWRKVEQGVYTGFSVGGRYGKRWADPQDPSLTRYEAFPEELSLVDNPCMYGAEFEVIKQAGAAPELRKFTGGEASKGDEMINQEQEKEGAPAEEASESPEKEKQEQEQGQEQGGMSAEMVKQVVIDLLKELGLVREAGGPQQFARAAQVEDLQKAIAEKAEKDDLEKISGVMDDLAGKTNGDLQKRADDLQKVSGDLKKAFGDLAKVSQAVESLEEDLAVVKKMAAGVAPVLREIGMFGGSAIEGQPEAMLKAILADTSDPQMRQFLGQKLTEMQIKAVQKSGGQAI